jgi:hypothetical protein
MRRVFLAGATGAVVYVVADRAIRLLNEPSDLSVAAGYFLLVALASVSTGAAGWVWRRL